MANEGNNGNNGNTANLMFRTPDLKKDQITGGAIEELSKLCDLLNYTKEENIVFNEKIKKYIHEKPVEKPKKEIVLKEIDFVTIGQLSQALKWSYNQIRGASYSALFDSVVFTSSKGRAVKIENVPKFCEILYKFMEEAA